MTAKSVQKLFKSFSKQTVLIIGDVMIDSYIKGKIERMSPEAPVPVVNVMKKEQRLGGAANVALNIQSLGAKPVVCAINGNDDNAKTLEKLFRKNKLSTEGLLQIKNRPTTVKTRVICDNSHVLRIDEETQKEISASETEKLFRKIVSITEKQKISVIIFEDYDKGCITASLIKEVVKLAVKKNIPVAVDPKKRNFLSYIGVTLFKPNLKELKEGLKIKKLNPKNRAEVEKAVETLRKKLNAGMVLLTLSENGVYVSDKKSNHHLAAHKRKVIDVSGAGDTVIAVAALCLGANTDSKTLAELANLAGGLVCEKAGVVPVDKKLLLKEAVKSI
ncbi:MAG: D-beta-D-heptose 7-phosphate kinase [Bacteroidia bacterium]|nr:D-beta-D-heptose 7-phosphate kinase [Bacteroidia bacterium]